MNGSTAFSRSPIVACIPVSTNVIVHSSMSLRSSLISRPAAGEHEVVRQGLVVGEEELLDRLGLVAQAEDEVLVPPGGVVLHDVPEDRPAADRDHRLRDACVASPMRMPRPPQKMTTFKPLVGAVSSLEDIGRSIRPCQ